METSERRRKILDIFFEKGPLSYEEILAEMSEYGSDIDILIDIDNLVFFKFIECMKDKKILRLKSEMEGQMKDNPREIDHKLARIVNEIPPWYRKLSILTILDKKPVADAETILHALKDTLPHMGQLSQIVDTSLRILESHKYISRIKGDLQKITLTDKARKVLLKPPIEKFSELKKLEDEFNDELKTFAIIDFVRKYREMARGISTGMIIVLLQEGYGKRGNNRNAVRKMLDSMVYCGLLNVSEDKRGLMGGSYTLGDTALSVFGIVQLKRDKMNMYNHSMDFDWTDFRKTVETFFNSHEIVNFSDKDKVYFTKALDFVEHYNQNMEIAPRHEWVSHIMFLSKCLQSQKHKSWEKLEIRCTASCILSQLLPAEVSVRILQENPPPLPSKEQYPYHLGIAREYYFNVTEILVALGKYEKAFQSFDHVESLCWRSFDFLILKGRIEILRCDVRKPSEFRKVIEIFEEAENISSGREIISALFHKGLAYSQRGYFEEAEETWKKCLKLNLLDDQKIILKHNLANIEWLSGNLENAKNHYEELVKMTQKPTTERFNINSLIGLTDVLIDLCLWDRAEEILKETIQKCEEKKFPKTEALAKAAMGNLLTKKGEYGEALSYLEEAVTLGSKVCDPYEYSSILIHLGDTFRRLKMTDEAQETYNLALNVLGKGDIVLIQTIEIKKADISIDRGNLDKGLEYAGAILQEQWLGIKRSMADAHRIQGRAYLLKKNFYEAKKQLEKSEELFKQLNLQYELLEVHELLEKLKSQR